ncbi:aspartate-semialdehyde dehydrogenase [Phycisphaerales bacterium]|nr:aspartate-semialdehyde dehydrogenase [Phycisphaerales bacterium]
MSTARTSRASSVWVAQASRLCDPAAGRIAVVGATGAVGREVLAILADRGVGAERVIALASDRSEGTEIAYGERTARVAALRPESFAGAGIAIFGASADIAREFAPHALRAGALVVDNSSAFRMDPAVPLVVPEVNGELLEEHRRDACATHTGGRIIANPNCSTIILLTALEPLRRAFGIERVHVATYQAVSGAGLAAMDELREQAGTVLAGGAATPKVFREPCAFNVFSHDSAVDESDGLNVEERKIIEEAAKIWGEHVPITPTCVRVPVLRAHSQAITLTLRDAASVEEVRGALRGAPGVRVIDDRAANEFPTPLKAAGGDEVLVGRVRHDPATEVDASGRSRGVCLWVCGDQLRKGAALNAVQIAERVFTIV